MSIKLSYRDKVILLVLIVLVILIAGIMLFVRPKFDQSNAKKTELDAKTTEQQTIQDKIDTLDDLQRQILTSISDINAYQQIFYTEGKHYEMEQLFQSLTDESRLDIATLDFTTNSEQIADYLFTPSVGLLMYNMKVNADLYNALPPELYNYMNGIQAVSIGSVAVGVTTYNVTFNNLNTWAPIEDFLNASAASNKSIYVTTYTRNDTTPDDGTLSTVVKIYHIVPMDTLAVWNAEKAIAEAQEPNKWEEISAGLTEPAPSTPPAETPAA
jgi:cell division protein FtsL